MRHRFSGKPLVAALAAALTAVLAVALGPFLASTWRPSGEGIPIPPAPTGPSDATDPGLGPGVRPLSFGPGDKSSPRVNPSGDRLSFVLDGAVADKPLYAKSFGRQSESDFSASSAEWLSGDHMAVLGKQTVGENAADVPDSLFLTRPGDAAGAPRLLEVAKGVQAADTLPQGGLVAAVQASQNEGSSKLMLVRRKAKTRPGIIPGRIMELSTSPEGTEATLAVGRGEEAGEAAGRVELLSYRFFDGYARRMALLPDGQELLGAPQWTDHGVHFVAGKEGGPYALYRVPESSGSPEPVRGVGEDFLPAAIEASPDGEKLAVVGRRNAGAPTDVYVLDLESGTLEAVTANENMEVQAGPQDLAWSPDGSGVVLIARVALSEPEVYDAPARDLAPAFYNLYLAPVKSSDARSSEGTDRL